MVPVYTECLRLCGNWLAETCLESPGVILEKYLERVGGSLWDPDHLDLSHASAPLFLTVPSVPLVRQAVEMIEEDSGGHQDTRLQSQRTEAFLSLARFSDAQYQSIDKYMNSSEFENKRALLEKAKEEVDLLKEHKVTNNRSVGKMNFIFLPQINGSSGDVAPLRNWLTVPDRYTVKVQRELDLDQKALSNLQADRQRFLCKAVENYAQCLGQGEEHDTWVFRLASLWLENAGVKEVNDIMKVRESQLGPPPPHVLLDLTR